MSTETETGLTEEKIQALIHAALANKSALDPDMPEAEVPPRFNSEGLQNPIMKNDVKEFAETTTLHGLQELIVASGSFKIAWAVVMAISIGCMGLQLYTDMKEYLRIPIGTRVYRTQVIEPLYITVCPVASSFELLRNLTNLDLLRKQGHIWLYWHRMNSCMHPVVTHSFVLFKKETFIGVFWCSNVSHTVGIDRGNFTRDYRPLNVTDKNQTGRIVKELSSRSILSLEDVAKAFWNHILIDEVASITDSYYVRGLTGICKVFSPYMEKFPEFKVNIAFTPIYYKGFYVSLTQSPLAYFFNHPSDIKPCDNSIKILFTEIEPYTNMDVYVSMSPEHNIYVNTSSEPCIANHLECMKKCTEGTLLAKNGCFLCIDVKNCSFTLPMCDHEGDFRLLRSSQDLCLNKCPRQCEEWDYSLRNRAGSNVILMNTDNFDIIFDLPSNKKGALVYHEYFVFKVPALIANLGGTFSLFMGASIISFFHVVYFCINCMVSYVQRTLYQYPYVEGNPTGTVSS